MAKENAGKFKVPIPLRCHASTAIAKKAKEYEKADTPQALKFWAVLPDAE